MKCSPIVVLSTKIIVSNLDIIARIPDLVLINGGYSRVTKRVIEANKG